MKKPDYSWQDRCVDDILTSVSQGNRDYLVNATPGAGKTEMTVKLAQHMIVAGMVGFVVVVVPTSTVRDQFVEKMAEEGITLAKIVDGEAFRNMKAYGFGEHVHGFCLTTGMLMGCAEELALMTERYKVLHVSDEAHHNGYGLDWGDSAIAASRNAVLRLGLSGTPYRSDKHEIPFLRYEEGKGVPHFDFTFKQARDAGLITAISFRSMNGYVDVADTAVSDTPVRYSYDDITINDEMTMSQRLNYSLHYASPYLQAMLACADEELELIRETQPNAAGIVFANTTKQAQHIARYLREKLGRKVRLVVDDADSSEQVKAFNDSKEEWLVQIRKVYEGANIPRLRVGVYATNWLTEGFFDQASKRLVRRLDDIDPDSMPAIMFMPADTRLHAIATGLGDVVHHDINRLRKPFKFMPTDTGDDRDETGLVSHFEILGGTGHLGDAIIEGKTYSSDEMTRAEDYFADDAMLRRQPSVIKMALYVYMQQRGKL